MPVGFDAETLFNADEVRARLRALADELGSQSALAKKAGVSPAYLSDILLKRREPTDAICDVLNMRRAIVYYERSPRKKGGKA